MDKCAHMVEILLLLWLLTAKEVWTVGLYIAANQTILLTRIGERGIIQSAGFPHKCCEQQYITLQLGVIAAQLKAYIHLVFTDLDLPIGTNFKIYKTANELPQNLFLDQPSYKHGMWQRPFITSTRQGQVIHLVLTPSKQNNYNASFYSGFRASYIVKKSEVPYYKMTSELCPPIASVVEGSIVAVKPQPTSRFADKWLDCVWHIKTPDGSISFGHNEEDQFRTYIRITDAKLTRGQIEIHRGRMSTSPEMAKGKTLADLRQPEEGFTGHHGFYIHVFMPADDRQNRFTFVYGVIHYLSTGVIGGCEVGFQCPNNLNWCLPMRNICNKVKNCPDGADERQCDEKHLMSTRVYRITTPQTITTTAYMQKSSCSSWLHDCGDGRCLFFEADCDTNIGKGGCSYMSKLCSDGRCVFRFDSCPDECALFEKTCSDASCVSSTDLCPDEPCPSYEPYRCNNNHECYSNSDRCDNFNDCTDGTDEENCSTGSHLTDNTKRYALLAIPVVIVFCACCIYCCQKRSISNSPQPGYHTDSVTSQLPHFLLIGVPFAVIIVCVSTCYRCYIKKTAPDPQPDPPHTAPRVFPVTSHLPAANSSSNNSPTVHGYTAVSTTAYTDTNIELTDLNNINTDNVDQLEPSAPPPSYEEVLNTDLYIPGRNDTQLEPPPPSYDAAIQGQQIHIL